MRKILRNEPFDPLPPGADVFKTSLTATAIRLVDIGSFPAVVLFSDRGDVRWFRRGPDVPESLWPHSSLGTRTFAHDIASGQTNSGSGDVYVDEWFKGEQRRHSVHEDSRRVAESSVVTIVWWTDETPLGEIVERDERLDARRSDWREED